MTQNKREAAEQVIRDMPRGKWRLLDNLARQAKVSGRSLTNMEMSKCVTKFGLKKKRVRIGKTTLYKVYYMKEKRE